MSWYLLRKQPRLRSCNEGLNMGGAGYEGQQSRQANRRG